MTQEVHRFEIFPAAEAVGHPFAGLSAVVAVEHGSDRVDAQPIYVEMLQPVDRRRDEEPGHFAPAEIVDQRVPVLMEALARVGMLIERGAVELGETVGVGRKMRRHEVDDNADAFLMAGIHEGGEILRLAEAARGREQPQGLVAPRAGEGCSATGISSTWVKPRSFT